MAYRESYKADIDDAVLGCLPDATEADLYWYPSKGTSIADIVQTGLRVGAVRNSLKRLLEEEIVVRAWDGNQRMGRYVYARKVEA